MINISNEEIEYNRDNNVEVEIEEPHHLKDELNKVLSLEFYKIVSKSEYTLAVLAVRDVYSDKPNLIYNIHSYSKVIIDQLEELESGESQLELPKRVIFRTASSKEGKNYYTMDVLK